MEKVKNSKLPKELTGLVNLSLETLGDAIRIEYGVPLFNKVERLRRSYKEARNFSIQGKLSLHKKLGKELQYLNKKEKAAIAHSFACSLELINACENAYRSYRLNTENLLSDIKQADSKPIIYVLTAHPTEARSAQVVHLMKSIQDLLIQYLQKQINEYDLEAEIAHKCLLLIKTPISKTTSPRVQDEAEFIYSQVIQPSILKEMAQANHESSPIYLRTWVGGDKDGHPGVDEKTMLASLNASRRRLLPEIDNYLRKCLVQLDLIEHPSKHILNLKKRIMGAFEVLKPLKKVKAGDGHAVKRFYRVLEQTQIQYSKAIGGPSPELSSIQDLLISFPGLVLPLELREDSEVIAEFKTNKRLAIARMLQQLNQISKGGSVTWYSRGLVISMCEEVSDMENTIALIKATFKKLELPIIPLFETKSALDRSKKLIEGFLSLQPFKQSLENQWDRKLEVMVGYSDSAKESGALHSRISIERSLHQLSLYIESQKYVPVFFHGSGGSVARGGGSVENQIAWWPEAARIRFKATIQGEMIYRNFSSAEIFRSQLKKIRTAQSIKKEKRASQEVRNAVNNFAEQVRQQYFNKVNDAEFLRVVSLATPYPYLDQLKIGSRPSKRKSTLALKSLRAIPWVLCWTQTRALFPVWWGIGTAWKNSTGQEKKYLFKALNESAAFRSFIKVLAYSMTKVDLSVWAYFLESSDLSSKEKASVTKEFSYEIKRTKAFLKDMAEKSDEPFLKTWLNESIQLRSTLIYPLNLLEIEALKTQDVPLLRETVTGVASGMLTTG